MKIAVIGANGMLGQDIVEFLTLKHQEVMSLDHGQIEISDPTTFSSAFGDWIPEIIINTASCPFDVCESSPYQAFMVNAVGAGNVAGYAKSIGAEIIHFSTDYVFDGVKNSYSNEEEKPEPRTIFGISKLAGEHMVKIHCDKHFIIRIGGVYGLNPSRGEGTNFILETIRLAGESDVMEVPSNYKLSPTWTMQIAKNMVFLADTKEYGLYHMVSIGDCTYADFAKLIVEELRLNVTVLPVELDLGNVPKNLLLTNKNLDVIRVNKMDFWDRALKRFLLNFEAH